MILIQFNFNSSIAQRRPRPNNDSRHTQSEPVFQWGTRGKEQDWEIWQVSSAVLLRQRSRDAHGCHSEAYDLASVFLPLRPQRDSSSSSLHCRFIASVWASCLFLSLALFFASSLLFSSFLSSIQALFVLLLLISGIVSADLVRSVVQICFCLYFNWAHHNSFLSQNELNYIYIELYLTIILMID